MNVSRRLVLVSGLAVVGGVLVWGAGAANAMWPQQAASELPYSFATRGGVSLSTAGNSGQSASVTYTRVDPQGGTLAPPGFGIFGFRDSEGVVLTETSVSAVPLIQQGRTVVSLSADAINTAIAIANPNDQEVTINFHFTDPFREDASTTEVESNFGHGSFTIGPHQQLAQFVSEEPFNFEDETRATFTFNSSVPVATVALSQFRNSRGDVLYNTLPMIDLAVPPSTGTVVMPHFATGFDFSGDRWTTDIILINPTEQTITGTLIFVSSGTLNPDRPEWDDPGISTPVSLNGSVDTAAYPYAVGPKGSLTYRTTPGLQFVKTGSIRAVPNATNQSPAPVVQVVFFNEDGSGSALVPLSQAAFSGMTPGSVFRMYVENIGTANQQGSIRSGFAVSQFALNTDGFVRTRLALELTDLAGNLIATTTVDVPSSGQRSMFVDEVFDPSQFPASGKAILRVETTTANTAIAMIGLRSRVNGRGDVLITTTPPVNESSTPLGSAVFFPHLVDGGGWSTQAVLFSGAIAQAGAGTMSFFGPDGQPFPIPLQ